MIRSWRLIPVLLLAFGVRTASAIDPTEARRREAYHDTLSVSQVGYRPADRKVAVVSVAEPLSDTTFTVVGADGQSALSGQAVPWSWPDGVTPWWDRHYYRLDFSELSERGLYRVECGGLRSPAFPVRNSVYRTVLSRDGIVTPEILLTGFMAAQRCYDGKCMTESGVGHPFGPPYRDVSETALPAHHAVRAPADSEPVPGHRPVDVEGGWHDASSKDKETVREALFVLHLARACESAPDLFGPRPGLLAELRWGLDYLGKLQDEDGGFYLAVQGEPFRDTRRVLIDKSVGLNMRCAGALAAGSRVFRRADAEYAAACLERARRGLRWVEENRDMWIPTEAYMGWFLDREACVAEGGLELYLALRDVPGAEGEAQRALTMALDYAAAGEFACRDDGWSAWQKKSGTFVRQATWTMDVIGFDEIVPTLVRLYPLAGPELQEKIRSDLGVYRDFMLKRLGLNPYNVYQDVLVSYWGQNGTVLRAGECLLDLGRFFDDERCIEAGRDQFRWVAGKNPFGLSYIVGFGMRYEDDLWVRPAAGSLGAVVPGILAFDGIPMARCVRMPEPWKTQELGIADGLIPILSLLDAFDGAPDPVDPAEATAGNRPLQPRRIVMDGSSSPLQPGQGTSIAYVAREQGYVLPHRDSEETESTMDFAEMLSALGGDNRLPEFGELRVEFAHPVATTHGWSRPVVWTVHLSNGWLMFVFHDAETLAVDIRAFDWSTNYHYTSEHAVADVSGLALAFDTDGFAVRTLVGGEWRTVEQQGWLTIPWGHGEGERPPYGYYPTYPSFRAQPMLHNWSMEEDLEVTRIVWDAHLPAGEGSATAP